MKTKINEAIKQALRQFGEKYFIGEVLNKNKVIQDLDTYDKDLLEAFISNDTLKRNFTIDIAGDSIMQINKLIELFETDEYWRDSYTKYSKKIGLTAGGKFIDESTDVVLDFPYKDTVLKASMSKEDTDKEDLRPDEPFLNEVIAKEEIDVLLDKKILVNANKYDVYGVQKIDSFSEDDNLIMKGNNLLALHTLKEKYTGKVKLIYIDPPYNTGNDSFKYNDRFNRSTWLTFMKNRLEIAYELLKDDGVIMVQCDDSEQEYLKVLMNEIFGSENHLSTFYIQVRYPDKQLATAMNFHKLVENIFVFGKTENSKIYREREEYSLDKYVYTIEEIGEPNQVIELGNKKVEVFNRDNYKIVTHQEGNSNYLKEIWASGKILNSSSTGRFFRDYLDGRAKEDGLGVLYKVHGIGAGLGYRYITGPKREGATKGKYYQEVPSEKLSKDYEGDLKAIPNFYDMADSFGNCRHEGGVELRSGKKPERLLKKIIEVTTKEHDLILDFHLGSGTTATVAHKMNRNYIGVEQMDYEENSSVNRLNNVINGDKTGISKDVKWQGGGSFVYVELMEKNRGFLKSIRDAETLTELHDLFKFMLKEAEIDFRVDLEAVKDSLHELSFDDQKKTLIKIIDKNQLYYNYSEIDDENVRDLISDNDYAFNKNFYDKGGE